MPSPRSSTLVIVMTIPLKLLFEEIHQAKDEDDLRSQMKQLVTVMTSSRGQMIAMLIGGGQNFLLVALLHLLRYWNTAGCRTRRSTASNTQPGFKLRFAYKAGSSVNSMTFKSGSRIKIEILPSPKVTGPPLILIPIDSKKVLASRTDFTSIA